MADLNETWTTYKYLAWGSIRPGYHASSQYVHDPKIYHISFTLHKHFIYHINLMTLLQVKVKIFTRTPI